MGYSSNSDYQNFERNVFSGGPAHEVSGETEACIRVQTREHSCNILIKNLGALFTLLEKLGETEYENN